jgi:hypothetical protein
MAITMKRVHSHAIDFRSVYTMVLQNWLGAEPSAILGQPFPVVEFV